MRKITFLKDGIDRILTGSKRATTRLGEDDFYQGELLRICDQDENEYATIEITKKEKRLFNQLDNNLARIENWPDLKSFKDKLEEIYGDIVKQEILTVYFFILTDSPKN